MQLNDLLHFTFGSICSSYGLVQDILQIPHWEIFINLFFFKEVHVPTDIYLFFRQYEQYDRYKYSFIIALQLHIPYESPILHTSQNLFYKWIKISSLEINIFEINHISLICLQFFILKFTEPLQSYCCPVQKNLPRKAELARQVSRYL